MSGKSNLLESILDVGKLILLVLCIIIIVILFLYSIKFDFKSYDVVLSSRLNSSNYYGIELSPDLEVWKIERSEDGSLYTRRLFPQ